MEAARLTTVFDADTRGLDRAFTQSQSKFGAFAGFMAKAGGALAAVLGGIGIGAIRSAASMDSLVRGLTVVSGSADAAQKQLAQLREVAKLPGLGFREAIQGATNLQAAGLSAVESTNALRSFGNALATVGKGKSDLDGVITALTQIASKGKISAEEINQLAERVPQIRKVMESAFGTSNTEILQKQGIDATTFINKIVSELGKLPQATGGAQNALENFKDTLDQTLVAIGGPLLDPLTKALDFIGPLLQRAGQAVSQFLGNIPQVASNLWQSLPQSFRDGLGVIFDIVQSVGAQIVGWFHQNLPLIQQTVNTVLTAIGDFWKSWGGTIKTIVQTTLNTILGIVKVVMQALNGDWRGAWNTLTEIVKTAISKLPEIIGGILNFAATAALALGKAIVKAIWAGLISLPERAVSILKAGLQALWNLAGWLWSEGWKLGKAIIDGLWQGIKSIFSSVTTNFQNELKNMIAGAEATLQKGSPSKVFIEIGKSIPQGLAIGIESGIETASQAMDRLLDATIRKFTTRDRVVGARPIDDAMQAIKSALEDQAAAIKELSGGTTALEQVNNLIRRVLANPATAHLMDANTQALLRFNAALLDNSKLTRERRVFGEPPEEQRPRIFNEEAWRESDRSKDTRPRRVLADTVSESRKMFEQIAWDLSDTVGQAFRDLLDGDWRGMLTGMLDSARDTFAAIAQEFISKGLHKLIMQLIGAVVGGIGGGGGYSGLDNYFGEMPLPSFASGGNITPFIGQPIQVHANEKILPLSPGYVVPKGGTGGGNTFITINVPVARSSGYTQPKNRKQLGDDIFRRLR